MTCKTLIIVLNLPTTPPMKECTGQPFLERSLVYLPTLIYHSCKYRAVCEVNLVADKVIADDAQVVFSKHQLGSRPKSAKYKFATLY